MKKTELIRLVKSLSRQEKRFFKLSCKKQTGLKVYLGLFKIICQHPFADKDETIEIKFYREYPGKSYENAAQYLLKIITDALVQIGINNDKWFQQYHSLMRSKVLFERSLSTEGYKEIKKTQQLSLELQDNLIQFQSHRMELNYLSDVGFAKMDEKDVVEIQMKTKSHLRQLHLLQEHSSLYELLRFRLTRFGRSFSSEDTDKLNDLLISELSLITRGNQNNFESQKIHLLFQSFFLIHTGQFKASLKSFRELNTLFEGNKVLWSFPPYDYLFTLEGILDNLRTIRYFEEMKFYIEKIENLLNQKLPDHFQVIAWQTVYIYKLHMLLNISGPQEALRFSKNINATLSNFKFIVDYEKSTELMLYIGLVHFCNKEFTKVSRQMSKIIAFGKVKENSISFKVSWLTHILTHYELDNLDFLEYEIRAYKRAFFKAGKSLKIERLIFRLIKHNPKRRNNASNLKFWIKIKQDVEHAFDNIFEKQILKYYDFGLWIEEKLA